MANCSLSLSRTRSTNLYTSALLLISSPARHRHLKISSDTNLSILFPIPLSQSLSISLQPHTHIIRGSPGSTHCFLIRVQVCTGSTHFILALFSCIFPYLLVYISQFLLQYIIVCSTLLLLTWNQDFIDFQQVRIC